MITHIWASSKLQNIGDAVWYERPFPYRWWVSKKTLIHSQYPPRFYGHEAVKNIFKCCKGWKFIEIKKYYGKGWMFKSLYSLLFLSDEDHCVRCTRNFVLSGNFHRSCSRRLYKWVQFNVPTMWRHLWFLWSMQAVHGWSRQLQKQLQETRPVLQDMAITWQQYAALMRANTIGSFQGRFCVLIPWIFRQFFLLYNSAKRTKQ